MVYISFFLNILFYSCWLYYNFLRNIIFILILFENIFSVKRINISSVMTNYKLV